MTVARVLSMEAEGIEVSIGDGGGGGDSFEGVERVDKAAIEEETSPTALQVDGGRVAPAEGEMARELFAAIRKQDKGRARQLLEMEADVNAYEPVPCQKKEALLLIALLFPPGLLIIALLIILPELCVIEPKKYKKTPLHVAVTTGDPDMVALLLEFGADRNAPAMFMNCSCCKYTPTQFVVSIPPEQRAPIKELLME